ncbi:MAG: hypothetical protein ACREFV_02405, partial [Acetobacteraceae bacterium]
LAQCIEGLASFGPQAMRHRLGRHRVFRLRWIGGGALRKRRVMALPALREQRIDPRGSSRIGVRLAEIPGIR